MVTIAVEITDIHKHGYVSIFVGAGIGIYILQDSDDWGLLQLNHLNDADFGPRRVIHCLVNEPALIVISDNQD